MPYIGFHASGSYKVTGVRLAEVSMSRENVPSLGITKCMDIYCF